MAKQIVWSIKARSDQLDIFEYWKNRNKSTIYPRKLFKLFEAAIEELAAEPIPRRSTEFEGVLVKIVRNYKIFFKETEDAIFIITIWDTRQNPENLNRVIKRPI